MYKPRPSTPKNYNPKPKSGKQYTKRYSYPVTRKTVLKFIGHYKYTARPSTPKNYVPRPKSCKRYITKPVEDEMTMVETNPYQQRSVFKPKCTYNYKGRPESTKNFNPRPKSSYRYTVERGCTSDREGKV